ncbi:MAG: hypothetical protein QM601_07630 [Pseudoxanthomonas sp.]
MNHEDMLQGNQASSDFTLLEGLYQLAVTGRASDWEYERLNNAVYERLLSSYGEDLDATTSGSNAMPA